MPYIKKDNKPKFQPVLHEFQDVLKKFGVTDGDLNYLITKLCLAWAKNQGENYSILSDVDKTLSCAQKEFYRRKLAPYEDLKALENGDVFAE